MGKLTNHEKMAARIKRRWLEGRRKRSECPPLEEEKKQGKGKEKLILKLHVSPHHGDCVAESEAAYIPLTTTKKKLLP